MELKETMEEEPMKAGGKRVVIRINESNITQETYILNKEDIYYNKDK